ncbi:MAG: hypothetical protein U0K71_11255 [Paludibacteraceae bacterium]|nr:hypothetical protein [Paludibacteraceae bacterium]
MKYVFTLFLIFVSTHLLATDVSMMDLNGPVKSYSKDGETFYFDKSGNLTHAVRSTKEGLISTWNECYIHIFDEEHRRKITNIFKDSTCKEKLDAITYRYDKNGILKSKYENGKYRITYYNEPPFWKDVLSKYGKRKHKPNSEVKKVRKTDTIYCSYNEKGELALYKLIAPSLCTELEMSFGEDTIINFHLTDGYTIVNRYRYNSKNQLLEYFHRDTTGADTRICIEHYKYNDQGLLEEKSIYGDYYNVTYTIHDMDCIITYKYDSWNNLVGEEWYHKSTKQTNRKDYPIEYY